MKVDRRHENRGRPGGGVTALAGVTRTLTKEELKQFLLTSKKIGKKFDLMFSLIFYYALRAGECAALKLADFRMVDQGEGARQVVVIKGLKGGRVIEPPVPAEITEKLIGWLKQRKHLPQADKNVWLFPSRTKQLTAATTAEGIKAAFRKVAKAAAVEGRHSVHDLRHTRAQFMALDGLPLVKIASWLRHTSVDSSARYVHPLEMAALADTMERSWEELLK